MTDGSSVQSESERLPGLQDRDQRRVGRRTGVSGDRSRSIEVTLDPSRVIPYLVGVVVVLSLLSLIGQILDHGLDVDLPGLNTYVRYTDIDHEANIPTWFQSSVLLLNALVIWTIAGDSARRGDGWAKHWRLLSLAFVYLSVDDLTEIHEQAIVPIQKVLGVGGFLYFAWIMLAVPLLAVFGLFYLRFLRALPRPALKGILAAATLYIGGAIAFEMVGGQLFSSVGQDTVVYSLEAAGEELLEMLGMVVMLATVARHLRTTRAAADAPAAPAAPTAAPDPVPDPVAGWAAPVQPAPVAPGAHPRPEQAYARPEQVYAHPEQVYAHPEQAYARLDVPVPTDQWPGVVDLTDGRSGADWVEAQSADRPRSGRRRRGPEE